MEVKELREAMRFACTVDFLRMAVLWTLSLFLSYMHMFSLSLFSRKSESYARCSPSSQLLTAEPTVTTSGIRNPICIITGATSGLGAAAAYALSREGFYVVLAGRSSHLLSKTISDIKTQNKGAYLKAFQVDLSSFQSIQKFKDSFQQWLLDSDLHPSIQLLINNAGILATSRRPSAGARDKMMETNYIGPFSLTKVLLPLLENSPFPSRIINVTSFTHRNVSNVHFDKETVSGRCYSHSKRYPFSHIYEYSKLCILLFSYELHRQLDLTEKCRQVSVIAVDPGVVKTNIMREIPSCVSEFAYFALKLLGFLQSPETAVRSILDAALAPPEVSGVYFFGGNGKTVNSSALSYNTKLSKELWNTTCDLFLESQLASKDTSA